MWIFAGAASGLIAVSYLNGMKIGIDARFALRNRRGIGNYTLKLLQCLAQVDKLNEYVFYGDTDDLGNVLPKQDNVKLFKLRSLNYFLWEQLSLPLQADRDGLDILHCTGNTAPIWSVGKYKLIVTVHDVMYMKDYTVLAQSMSMYQRLGRIYRKTIVPRAVSHANKIITVSNYSKKDICLHLPKIKENTIVVTYEAAGEKFSEMSPGEKGKTVAAKLGVTNDYVFTLGALDPRKNTQMVIDSFLSLKQTKQLNLSLIISGIPKWRSSVFYKTIQQSDFARDIVFTEFITQEELVGLYQGAKVFLYPSLYEGFGIPPLEAMACGAPVITSNTTSIPEIAGDAALLINPASSKELEDAIFRLLTDEGLRKSYIEKGFKRAKEFSWRKMAEETLNVYESVYRGADSFAFAPLK